MKKIFAPVLLFSVLILSGRERYTAENRIAAAMVLNRAYNDAYRSVSWKTDIRQEHCIVIRMPGLHSAFAGKGYAKETVRYAIGCARSGVSICGLGSHVL